jgi:hypothetical protein
MASQLKVFTPFYSIFILYIPVTNTQFDFFENLKYYLLADYKPIYPAASLILLVILFLAYMLLERFVDLEAAVSMATVH